MFRVARSDAIFRVVFREAIAMNMNRAQISIMEFASVCCLMCAIISGVFGMTVPAYLLGAIASIIVLTTLAISINQA